MRTLALDYGDKNIGVAVSDPLGIFAVGLETIRRTDAFQLKGSLERLRTLIEQYEVNEIILGYPKNMNNTEGTRCECTKTFMRKLIKTFAGIQIILWDERLSTLGAMRYLTGLSNRKKNDVIDKMAAVYILQGYLDGKNAHYDKGVSKMETIDDNEFDEDDLEDDDDIDPDDLEAELERQELEDEIDPDDLADAFELEELEDEIDPDDLEAELEQQELEDDPDLDDEYEVVTLEDDDGGEFEVVIINMKEFMGTKYYLIAEKKNMTKAKVEVNIMKEVQDDGDDELFDLLDSESDEEYAAVAGLFKLENDEFDIE